MSSKATPPTEVKRIQDKQKRGLKLTAEEQARLTAWTNGTYDDQYGNGATQTAAVPAPQAAAPNIAPNLSAGIPSIVPGQENELLQGLLANAGSVATGTDPYWDDSNSSPTRYPKVFMGMKVNPDYKAPERPSPLRPGQPMFNNPLVKGGAANPDPDNPKLLPDVMTLEDAVHLPSTWSPQYRAQVAKKMNKAGLIKDPGNWDEFNSAWAKVVTEAAYRYAQSKGELKTSPYDMIDIMGGVQSKSVPKTTTDKTTSIDVIDPGSAHAWIRTIFQDKLGRDPTPGELSQYGVMLTGYAKQHPTVTTRTTTEDTKGNTTTQQSQTGGITTDGAAEQITNKVKGDPGYGAYQAATTYYNAVMNAVGSLGTEQYA